MDAQEFFVGKLRPAAAMPCGMSDEIKKRGDRLAQAAKRCGFTRQKDVIEAHKKDGVTSSYYQHSAGNVGYSFKYAQLYGRIFGVRPQWLYSGDGPMIPERSRLPVIGRVAAGEAEFNDDYAMGAADDWLDPPDTDGRIALRIDGDSMAPLAHHGDYAVFGPRHDDPTSLIGRRVMARLDDGRKLFKVLRKGSAPGRYTLYSLNSAYDPVEDAVLLWALPLEWIRTQ